VDEQIRGPFKHFRHEHRFEPSGHLTRMTDSVVFDAPGSIVGIAAERLVLGRYLRQLIEARNAHLARVARDRL
jgi:ligand-binding SRPBCC domain-containing protein